MHLESCTGGHGASKSSRDLKTVDYSPRKQPEMREITSFNDAARVMYRGSRGIEILSGPKNPGQKSVVYRGVTVNRNPPGTRKPRTIAHENIQKCLKS